MIAETCGASSLLAKLYGSDDALIQLPACARAKTLAQWKRMLAQRATEWCDEIARAANT